MRAPATRARRVFVTTSTVLAFALLACTFSLGALADSSWSKFHGGPRNSGLADGPGTLAGDLKWPYLPQTGGAIESSPVLWIDEQDNDKVYLFIGSHDGRIRAFDADTAGTPEWKINLGSAIASAPAVAADGTVYAATWDGKVYALDARNNGAPKWGQPFSRDQGGFNESYSSPAIAADGTVYVAGTDGYLYAINPNGTEKWKVQLAAWSDACPAIAADGTPDATVYIAAGSNLYAFDSDGVPKDGWPVAIPNGTVVSSSPAVTEDGTVIYVGTVEQTGSSGYLCAVSSEGQVKWNYRAGGPVYSSPAIDASDHIYFGCDDRNLYCLRDLGDTVQRLWLFPTGSWIDSSPAVSSDGFIYFGSRDGWFYSVDPTGSEFWSYRIGSEVSFSSPAIGPDAAIYVGASNGKVYAFKASSEIRIAASNASGSPGDEDIPVDVSVDTEVTIKRFEFTLHFDSGILDQPAETDVSTTLADFTLDVTPATDEVRVVGNAGTAQSVPAGRTLATVEFDILPTPTPTSCPLIITGASLSDAEENPVQNVGAGPPGTFSVTGFSIYPQSPQAPANSYLNFRAVGAAGPITWVLTSTGSGPGAQIDPSTGLYLAGAQPGTDEVTAFMGAGSASTEVSVVTSAPPGGTPGAPTSLDVDGGGVSLSDVILILRAVMGMEELTPEQEAAADFDGNGVGLSDVIAALRIVVGMSPSP